MPLILFRNVEIKGFLRVFCFCSVSVILSLILTLVVQVVSALSGVQLRVPQLMHFLQSYLLFEHLGCGLILTFVFAMHRFEVK